MPKTLPGVNGRELPTRSAEYRPPRAEPPGPRGRPWPKGDATQRMRRDFHRLAWGSAIAAILCAVAWSATQDAGYLVLALAATVTTVMVAAATIKE